MNEVTGGTNYRHGSQHGKLQSKAPARDGSVPKGSGEKLVMKMPKGRVNDPREKGGRYLR